MIALRASGVAKRYLHLDTPWSRLRHVVAPQAARDDQAWALHPLDIELRQGESLGIVGRNGSGKSTLLGILAGVIPPTVGRVEVHGRVSALLELGSGFNPDFTGRDNVFFSAMLHGFTRDEVQARLPQIVAFAEIGEFFDRPVKTYSTGMFVRLAFAVAIAVEPQILIVDEALAVGDVFFQQKCFERLRTLRESGTTLLFVSHDSSAVYRFCDRAILLEHGRVIASGSPKDVIETYEAALIAQRDRLSAPADPDPALPADVMTEQAAPAATVADREIDRPTEVEVVAFGLEDARGAGATVVVSDSTITIAARLRFLRDFADPHAGFKIRNRFGEVVFETNTYCMGQRIGGVRAGDELDVRFELRASIHDGEYTLTLGVADGGYGEGLFRRQLLYRHDLVPFKVLRDYDGIMWSGIANLHPTLRVSRQSEVDA